jgi:hypothetical protein
MAEAQGASLRYRRVSGPPSSVKLLKSWLGDRERGWGASQQHQNVVYPPFFARHFQWIFFASRLGFAVLLKVVVAPGDTLRARGASPRHEPSKLFVGHLAEARNGEVSSLVDLQAAWEFAVRIRADAFQAIAYQLPSISHFETYRYLPLIISSGNAGQSNFSPNRSARNSTVNLRTRFRSAASGTRLSSKNVCVNAGH